MAKEKKEYADPMKMCHNHWEKDVSDSVFPKANKRKPFDALVAKEPDDWPRPHVKVNECDY